MHEADILRWFRDTAYGGLVREVYWLFSLLEIVHFIALCVLFGAILFIDLRLLGFNKRIPIDVCLRFIPVALVAFVLSLASGLGFFCSAPLDYWPNPSFRLKMLLVACAGLNAAWFAIVERKSRARAESALSVRISAGLSITIWIAVIVLGRLLPYTGTSQ
jgi:hypothetical protein